MAFIAAISGHDLPDQSVQPDHEPKAFLQAVDQLEIAACGRDLNGRGRAKCLQAFLSHPAGFAIVVRRAIHEAKSNPIGLLLWMLDRNLHVKAQRAAERNGDGIEFG